MATPIHYGDSYYWRVMDTARGKRLTPVSEPEQKLCEAAPKMLEALRATLKHVDDDMNNRPIVLWKLRETVCAAIADAEGR